MNYKLFISKNPHDTAYEVAELIAKEINLKAENCNALNIAVSGGNTPKILFEILADEFGKEISWKAVRFFWVDERCVEPSHSDSNFKMTHDALLSKVEIPNVNIFRMKGEENPEVEAKRYSRILSSELPSKNGFPVFDLVLLGIGDDGHTASIFPNQFQLNNSVKSVDVASHPVSGQKRITLTGNTIRNAEKVIFLITGNNKADIISQIVEGKTEAEKYPASYMGNKNGEAEIYLDEAAAALLK